MVFDFVLPYMTAQGVPMARYPDFEPETRFSENYRSLSIEPEVEKRIFNDPEFLSILEVRHGFLAHTVEEYEDLISATESIVRKLENSLGIMQ